MSRWVKVKKNPSIKTLLNLQQISGVFTFIYTFFIEFYVLLNLFISGRFRRLIPCLYVYSKLLRIADVAKKSAVLLLVL